MQIIRATNFLKIAIGKQLVGHKHHIHRLAGGEQINDGVIYRLMLRLVEVGHVDGLRHLADGILAHQHAAEHGHFRVVVMRRHTIKNRVASSCRPGCPATAATIGAALIAGAARVTALI